MTCWMQVLAVFTVALVPSILSHGKNFDFDPFSTNHEIQTQKSETKVNTPKGEVQVKPEYVDELNEMIARYFLTFEAKKSEIKNQNSLHIMETIKLLMAHSWIRTLKPDPDLVTVEDIDLEILTRRIEDELKLNNMRYPVVDAIITYTKEIEPEITKTFEKKRKSLENFENIFKKHIEKATDAKNEIDVDHLKSSWKEIFYIINQINDNLVVHRFAHKMYIQSYILNFIPEKERPVDKITLISTDQKSHKKFRVPSMIGMDMFSNILLGVNKEMDNINLNVRLSRYMKYFEEERKTTTDTNLSRSMNVVKHLITQGWIEKLNPPSGFLLPEHSSKSKEDIIKDLVQYNVDHPVRDAILLYTKAKEQSIENNIEKQKASLMKNYENIKAQIIKVPSYQQSEAMNKIENEVNGLQDLLVAHGIAKLFYLHTYQDNFTTEKSETLEIKSSKGEESKTFKVTPINLLSFYKKPIFD